MQIIQLLLSLSILVCAFGHYAAAKFFGCRVEKFYLFMDGSLLFFKRKLEKLSLGLGGCLWVVMLKLLAL